MDRPRAKHAGINALITGYGGNVPLQKTCPACGMHGQPFRSGNVIARDIDATKQSFRDLAQAEDLPPLRLMHDEGVAVWRCSGCGTLWRADAELWTTAVSDYEEDRYPEAMLDPTHRADRNDALANVAFFARAGVRPGAQVVEIACYAGGFLAAASLLGATAFGIDPNPQLVRFCRARGLAAAAGTIDDARQFGDVDVLVVLNCFDQLPDPRAFLATAAGVVRPGGSIVIRTPNGDFATAAHRPDTPARIREIAQRHLVRGVPFLACYSPRALDAMLRASGFCDVAIEPKPARDIDAGVPACGAPWLQLTARRKH